MLLFELETDKLTLLYLISLHLHFRLIARKRERERERGRGVGVGWDRQTDRVGRSVCLTSRPTDMQTDRPTTKESELDGCGWSKVKRVEVMGVLEQFRVLLVCLVTSAH